VAIAAVLLLCACEGTQSALNPAGADAERISQLMVWLAVGAAIVWTGVMAVAVYALRIRPGPHSERTGLKLIVGGGVLLPVVVVTALLVYGLSLMPKLLAPGDGLVIAVEGRQFWWRVRYEAADGRVVESANEIRLPAGRRTEFRLSASDVIHSFWIPSLAGKMDMIPGHETRLAIEPTRPGRFRGACAEFCGASHALMAFPVVVMPEGEFSAWLDAQADPARVPKPGEAAAGAALFLGNGCGACHRVAGTPADGRGGPDLTHVGSRLSIGAGTLPATAAQFARWTGHTDTIKPGVQMPAYPMLSADELAAVGAYLAGLQ
jgi:cytochrome c oxidase subunit 2